MRRLTVLLAATALFALNCGGKSNSPTAPTTQGALSVINTQVTSAKVQAGYQYVIRLTVRETGGVAVTVSGVDLRFSAGQTTIGTVNVEGTVLGLVEANATKTSGAITITDDNAGNPAATFVAVTVRFTDGNQRAGTSTGQSDIPRILFPPVINSFTADNASINPGGSTMLRWDVSGATSVSINNNVGQVGATGAVRVSPANTTTYVLTAANNDGNVTRTAFVSVNHPRVEYRVSGNGTSRAGLVTLSGVGGSTQQFASVSLPWSFTLNSVNTGDFLYVSAQNDFPNGCIKVEIFKSGSLYRQAESCGAYVIATASGSF